MPEDRDTLREGDLERVVRHQNKLGREKKDRTVRDARGRLILYSVDKNGRPRIKDYQD